jgi:uroporphyrinogen-III synthase
MARGAAIRQGVARTKSDAGYRTVVLPRFAVGMLLTRKITAADNLHDAIFASRRGTWLSPPNVRRQRRQARADTDHAAAQFGHGSKEVTKKHYIVKPALAPDSSHILEQLGASPTATGPERGDHGPSRAA